MLQRRLQDQAGRHASKAIITYLASSTNDQTCTLQTICRDFTSINALENGFGVQLTVDQARSHLQLHQLQKSNESLFDFLVPKEEITIPFPFMTFLLPRRTKMLKAQAAQIYRNFIKAGNEMARDANQRASAFEGGWNNKNIPPCSYTLAKELQERGKLSEEDAVLSGAAIVLASLGECNFP